MAASSSQIRAGGAYVELTVADAALRAGLERAQRMLNTFAKVSAAAGASLLALGGGTLGGLTLVTKYAAEAGDEMSKAADRTGVAVEALSGLKYAAEQSDASLDDLVGGLIKMQKAIGAAAGSKGPNAFSQIGLDAEKLLRMNPDQAFLEIVDALKKIQSPTERNAAAIRVFGRGAAALLPLMKDGAAGIRAMTADAEKMGLIIGTKDARAMTEFGDRVDDVTKEVKAMAFNVGAAIGTSLLPYAIAMKNALGPVVHFVAAHRDIAIAVGASAAGVATLGVGLLGVAAAAKITSIALGGVVSLLKFASATAAIVPAVFSGIVTIFGAVTGAISLAAGAIFSVLTASASTALAVGGIVALGGALIAGAAYFVFFTQTGQSALAYVGNAFGSLYTKAANAVSGIIGYFSPLLTTIKSTISGVADALAGGDWSLAGQIAMAGLQIAFLQGKDALLGIWMGLSTSLLETWATAMNQIKSMFNATIGAVAGLMVNLFVDDADAQAQADKIQATAEKLMETAKAFDAAGDHDRANDARKDAQQGIAAEAKTRPAAAKLAAARMVQTMTQDEQGGIDESYKAKMAEIAKRATAGEADRAALQKRIDELKAQLDAERKKAHDEAPLSWTGETQHHIGRNHPAYKMPDVPDYRQFIDASKLSVPSLGGYHASDISNNDGVTAALDVLVEQAKKIATNTAEPARYGGE